jgi:hypothetical protein
MTKNKAGSYTVLNGANVWPHELNTARALMKFGYVIEFRPATNGQKVRSADVYMDGELWEFKSPISDKLAAVERNLKRSKNQADCVVFDSRRMKKLPDEAIRREVKVKFAKTRHIEKMLYVARDGKIVKIP